MWKRLLLTPVSFVFLIFLVWFANDSAAAQNFIYTSPHADALYVSVDTTIILRYEESLIAESAIGKLTVSGDKSGNHLGELKLVSTGTTLIFIPDNPFLPDETVQVVIEPGILTAEGNKRLSGDKFTFRTSPKTEDEPYKKIVLEIFQADMVENAVVSKPLQATLSNFVTDDFVTLPSDYPPISITVSANDTDDGLIFLSNFTVNWSTFDFNASKPYLLILDDSGEPVFYRKNPNNRPSFDFKKQPNGLLTYFSLSERRHYALNSNYQIIDSYSAGNGYVTDSHDFQLLPNGHAFLMIYDAQPVDMSEIVPGGDPNAIVVGLVIQEIDNNKNVVFQWRSWDHIPITDSTVDLTRSNVDYVHGNSIELDTDDNIIISSRNLNEVTKIDRQTGEIIWRLGGGPGNEFTFNNDESVPISDQHDARRMPNGNITIFDNRARIANSTFARAVEYEIDEVNKIAEPIWQYRNSAASPAMGNAQRLPNGNTMIGWGSLYPSLTEVKPNGMVALELQFGEYITPTLTRNSYRAFRFPWQGSPTWAPMLVSKSISPSEIDLYFSWNGATDVASYQVLGGMTLDSLNVITSVPKTSFETKLSINDNVNCLFQVIPIMDNGSQGTPSNFVLADHCVTSRLYMPIIFVD